MARFLFTSWPFAGHYFPLVAIAKSLSEQGHRVAFYTGASACTILSNEGFTCFPFERVDETRIYSIMASDKRGSPSWDGVWRFQRTLRQWLVGQLREQVADLHAVVEKWKPDVIASEPTLFGSLLFLPETHDIPVAVASFIPACTVPGPGAPPFGLGLPEPTRPSTRLLARVAQHVTNLFARPIRQTIDRVRAPYGLSPLPSSVYGYMGRLPLYLVPTIPELDYQRRDLPPSVHYVGPYLWNRPHNTPDSAWLDELPSDRPWVHVSEGTMHNADPFLLRASALGLGELPLEVIMTTGNRPVASLGLGALSTNVRLTPWVSHSELLLRTDVVVTTGGAGTVLAALQAGVPLVLVPTEWDKPEIAQRMVSAGVAVRLSPRNCTPKQVREAVLQLIHEPSYRARARQIAALFATCNGAERASELLTSLIRDVTTPTMIPLTEDTSTTERGKCHAHG